MSNLYDKELEIAIGAVREAARVCQSIQSSITQDVLEKEDRSPVTAADFGSQAIICRALALAFPDDPVIGEEGADELRQPSNVEFLDRITAELRDIGIDATGEQICEWIDRGGSQQFCNRFWTLDPIDGTKGFLRGQQYAISLALIIEGRIDVAILCCPNLSFDVEKSATTNGSLFVAVRGQGATAISGEDANITRPLRVSSTSELSQTRFCESVESGHSAHGKAAAAAEQLGITKPPVRLDSQAKYAVVGRGEADIYLRLPTRADYNEKIWDHAGGVLIVEEAGGKVTDVTGRPLDFTHGRELIKNRGVVVSNGLLHDPILDALRNVGVA